MKLKDAEAEIVIDWRKPVPISGLSFEGCQMIMSSILITQFKINNVYLPWISALNQLKWKTLFFRQITET